MSFFQKHIPLKPKSGITTRWAPILVMNGVLSMGNRGYNPHTWSYNSTYNWLLGVILGPFRKGTCRSYVGKLQHHWNLSYSYIEKPWLIVSEGWNSYSHLNSDLKGSNPRWTLHPLTTVYIYNFIYMKKRRLFLRPPSHPPSSMAQVAVALRWWLPSLGEFQDHRGCTGFPGAGVDLAV